MNEFAIYTDSGCDIYSDTLGAWGVKSVSLTLKFSDSDEELKNEDITAADFYQRMRDGASAKTAAINIETFKDAFRPELEAGRDVLYLGFSSGLSNTYNAGRLAAEELHEEFPERRVITIDSLCASAGEGLFVKLVADKRAEGASIEDAARYATSIRDNLVHYFTVDDLKYLKRGGRISATSAFLGGMLNIKPVLHVDDEGKLVAIAKVRGRRAALTEMVKRYEETRLSDSDTIYISNGDCMDDVLEIKKMFEEKGGKVEHITDVGPVIGSHTGPGVLAVFFLGSKR